MTSIETNRMQRNMCSALGTNFQFDICPGGSKSRTHKEHDTPTESSQWANQCILRAITQKSFALVTALHTAHPTATPIIVVGIVG
jgi:hypothetical protein